LPFTAAASYDHLVKNGINEEKRKFLEHMLLLIKKHLPLQAELKENIQINIHANDTAISKKGQSHYRRQEQGSGFEFLSAEAGRLYPCLHNNAQET
jgi:hypothetical protein